MSQNTLGLYRAMVEGVILVKNLDCLLKARRQLIDLRRKQYDDQTMRHGLYKLIGDLDAAIKDHNRATVASIIAIAQKTTSAAGQIIANPGNLYNAPELARTVTRYARESNSFLAALEDQHLNALLTTEQIELIKRIVAYNATYLLTPTVRETINAQQQLLREKRVAAEQEKRAQLHRETVEQAKELAVWIGRFNTAIQGRDVTRAKHALFIIEESQPQVLAHHFAGQDHNMILARMSKQCKSLEHELFGRHGIRNLDAIAAN